MDLIISFLKRSLAKVAATFDKTKKQASRY